MTSGAGQLGAALAEQRAARRVQVEPAEAVGVPRCAGRRLVGTSLYFADRGFQGFMIDTRTALAVAEAGGDVAPNFTWHAEPEDFDASDAHAGTPVITGGRVYTVIWCYPNPSYWILLNSVSSTDGSGSQTTALYHTDNSTISQIQWDAVYPPVLGMGNLTLYGLSPVLFINAGDTLLITSLDGSSIMTRPLPDGIIASGLTYDDGTRLGPSQGTQGQPRLWFGDSVGNLWSLNLAENGFPPADGTPYRVMQDSAVYTTPVLYKDPQGGVTVLFGLSYDFSNILTNPSSLYGYDPANANVASIPTGTTQLFVLPKNATNGVVYAGGQDSHLLSEDKAQVPQVFGIRVDELPQALRAFVIESQMMQDPDAPGGDPTGSNPVPPSRARYQTHLTILDDDPAHPGTTAPRAREAVKIWADEPMTIQVLGQPQPSPS